MCQTFSEEKLVSIKSVFLVFLDTCWGCVYSWSTLASQTLLKHIFSRHKASTNIARPRVMVRFDHNMAGLENGKNSNESTLKK